MALDFATEEIKALRRQRGPGSYEFDTLSLSLSLNSDLPDFEL